jgi:xanthine/uracil permease
MRDLDVSVRAVSNQVSRQRFASRRTAYLLAIAGLQVAVTALTRYPRGTTEAADVWLAVTLWLVYLVYRNKTVAWELLTVLSALVLGLWVMAACGLVTVSPQAHGWWLMSLLTSIATVVLLVSPTVRQTLRGSQSGAR